MRNGRAEVTGWGILGGNASVILAEMIFLDRWMCRIGRDTH